MKASDRRAASMSAPRAGVQYRTVRSHTDSGRTVIDEVRLLGVSIEHPEPVDVETRSLIDEAEPDQLRRSLSPEQEQQLLEPKRKPRRAPEDKARTRPSESKG